MDRLRPTDTAPSNGAHAASATCTPRHAQPRATSDFGSQLGSGADAHSGSLANPRNPPSPGSAEPVLNVSAYWFVDIQDAPVLQAQLWRRAQTAGLLGTVLIAPEGINLFLAGAPAALRGWLEQLRQDRRFAALQAKESFSERAPFKRLLVKLKREIIRMNQPAIAPSQGRAPAVDAPTLARWLAQGHCDQGRPVLMLDTRNDFEVDAGRFAGAMDWRLRKFSDFPAALAAQRDSFKDKTVVTYCTGGIRCEKAALVMQQAGIEQVLQLDGGILKYFELAPGTPGWVGDCFVFDERVALAPDLSAVNAA